MMSLEDAQRVSRLLLHYVGRHDVKADSLVRVARLLRTCGPRSREEAIGSLVEAMLEVALHGRAAFAVGAADILRADRETLALIGALFTAAAAGPAGVETWVRDRARQASQP